MVMTKAARLGLWHSQSTAAKGVFGIKAGTPSDLGYHSYAMTIRSNSEVPIEEFGEMRRGEFGGRYLSRICPSRRLSKATIFC